MNRGTIRLDLEFAVNDDELSADDVEECLRAAITEENLDSLFYLSERVIEINRVKE